LVVLRGAGGGDPAQGQQHQEDAGASVWKRHGADLNLSHKWGRSTEGGEAPGGPGATTENTVCI
jgi:hypothetical protein